MNANKKNILIIAVIAIIVIVAIVLIFVFANKGNDDSSSVSPSVSNNIPSNLDNSENVSVSSDGTKVNNSAKLAEDKKFKGLTVTDIKLSAKSGGTTLTATIKNDTGADKQGEPVTIQFFDKDGNKISTLETYIGAVKNGSTSTIKAEITSDLSNAYDFVINAK